MSLYLSMNIPGIACGKPLGLKVQVAKMQEMAVQEVFRFFLSPLFTMHHHHQIPLPLQHGVGLWEGP